MGILDRIGRLAKGKMLEIQRSLEKPKADEKPLVARGVDSKLEADVGKARAADSVRAAELRAEILDQHDRERFDDGIRVREQDDLWMSKGPGFDLGPVDEED